MDEIHHAILRGDVETVRALVDGEPDLLGLADFDARTPLVLSVLAGSLPLVQYFVEGPAKAEVDEVRACRGILCHMLLNASGVGRFDRIGGDTSPMQLAVCHMPHTSTAHQPNQSGYP